MNSRCRSRTLSVSGAAVPTVSQLGADPVSPFSARFRRPESLRHRLLPSFPQQQRQPGSIQPPRLVLDACAGHAAEAAAPHSLAVGAGSTVESVVAVPNQRPGFFGSFEPGDFGAARHKRGRAVICPVDGRRDASCRDRGR